MSTIALLLFYLLTPVVLQRLAARYRWIHSVGVVTLCYIAGILAGNIPGIRIDEHTSELVMSVAVPLFIPLLLFSSDTGVWRKMGGKLALAYFFCIIAVTIAVVVTSRIFYGALTEGWKISGMLMGVYTGGTPNLSAIGMALGVEHEMIVVVNGAEMFFGAFWLLFLLTGARAFFGKFMKVAHLSNELAFVLDERIYWRSIALPLILAILVVGAGIGISYLLYGSLEQVVVLIVITTLGIVCSLFRKIRTMPGSYGLGNYFLLVFCVTVGSLADVYKIFGTAAVILGLVGTTMIIAIVIHYLLCRIARVDRDAFLISSTAGIHGPAFIPPVAKAIRNLNIIPVGMALSLLGLAAGNYIGIAIARILQSW